VKEKIMSNYTTDLSEQKRKTTDDARQGERQKGMPSVLAISTLSVSVIFAIMLAIVIA
jgi:uncharacterized protein YqhQ